ncbi:MAG: flagellar biosynthetic protein FliO [Alphaproteobacteria bacterium]
METVDYSRFILAFVFVLGLIGLFSVVVKRYGSAYKVYKAKEGQASRIEVIESRYIDARRKLMLVRRDDVEHLLLLGDGKETVIEAGIQSKQDE